MKSVVCSALLLLSICAGAQPLPTPPNFQKALAAGTRSTDGHPGKAYWQNRARYTITVSLAPPSKTVNGREEITYINNSPDALSELALKFFPNIHKAGAPRLGRADKAYLTEGLFVDAVTVNGEALPWTNDPTTFTTASLALPKPLASKDSVRLTFAWHYNLSERSGREGAIDNTTFFLAYFYPRIAVYDDYNGWDKIPFNDALEFYSDFNDYTLNVQVPANYVVWATGTLTNAAEVLQPAVAERFCQSLSADNTLAVASAADMAAKTVTAQNATNTWRFTAANVPDVALGISNHYRWDAGSVVVDKATGRRASVQAAYHDTAKDYRYMVQFGKESLNWLSHAWPGVPYPYEKTTVFQGYAGMEYPMMANDESYPDTTFSRFVAMHELAHTYMPFYMGTNETVYGFMDEGWVTALEFLHNVEKMGREKAEGFFKQFRVQGWIKALDRGLKAEPIATPLQAVQPFAIGDNEYGKPALGYLALKELLGDDLFRQGLHAYMRRWNGKHPSPWDCFNSFSNATGKDLNWFWNAWFFAPTHIDLAMKEVKPTTAATVVVVQNNGGMPAPFDVVATYTDGTTQRFRQTPAVWERNLKVTTLLLPTKKPVKSLLLDGGIFMDATPADNAWK